MPANADGTYCWPHDNKANGNAVFNTPITIKYRQTVSSFGIGRRMIRANASKETAPKVVRAQATVRGPYPSRAIATTINVPPQIRPRSPMESQLKGVGCDVIRRLIKSDAQCLYDIGPLVRFYVAGLGRLKIPTQRRQPLR